MGFQDVAFLPSRASVRPHFQIIVAGVKASGPPHVIKLWFYFPIFPSNFFAIKVSYKRLGHIIHSSTSTVDPLNI